MLTDLLPVGASWRMNASRAGLGPQVLIDVPGGETLSCIGELDFSQPYDVEAIIRGGDYPLVEGEVEIALLGPGGLVGEPLRHLTLPEGAEVARRVLSGDRSDFVAQEADPRDYY